MKSRAALALLSLTCLAAVRLPAQSQGSIDRGEALRRQREADQLLRDLRNDKVEEAPAISPDEAVDVGPQSILRRRQRHRWFEVDVDSQFVWTDNMFFNESKPTPTTASTLFLNSAQFNLTPPSWKAGEQELRPRVGYQHVWMNYALVGPKNDPNSGLPKSDHDFDAQTVFADVTAPFGSWQAQVGVDWQRLLGHQPTYDAYDEFYRDWSPRWSLSRVFNLGQRHAIVGAYLGSAHLTHVDPTPGLNDPDRNDRLEHNLLASYSCQLTPRILLQPGYRFQFTHYTMAHRLDQLHSFNGSVTVLITDWLFARAFGAYELRESDDPTVPDYRKLDAGVALGATLRF